MVINLIELCSVLRASGPWSSMSKKSSPNMSLWLLVSVLGTAVEARDVLPLPRFRDVGCYVEIGRGLRLERAHVDRYVMADTLRDCERACDRAFIACKSFSFSPNRWRENENCLLSRDDSSSLNVNDYRHFFRDQDFNFYERSYGSFCGGNNNLIEMRSCYDLKRTGEMIDSRYVRRVLRTRDRRECEEECDRDQLCKGFNYRFKTQGFNQYRDNCQISHQDGSNHYDFHKDLDFDFYEKMLDSRTCYPSEPTVEEVTKNDSSTGHGHWNNWNHGSGGGGWYGGGGHGGGGYYGGRDECFRLVEKERSISERDAAALFITRDINECELSCEQSRQFLCKMFSFSYFAGPRVRYNCLLSDIEYRELPAYSLIVEKDTDLYERRIYDRECAVDYQGNVYPHGEGLATVQGLRCYREPCRLDRQGGYYYCETDHTGTSWDYCCRPQERCGYSEGYQLPWCYVGMVGRDQWRPCNEPGMVRDYLKLGPPPGLVRDDNNTTATDADFPPTTDDYPTNVNAQQSLEVLDLF